MRFSIGLPTDHVRHAAEFVTGEAVMECARTAEAAGLDACFVTDHPAPDAKWLATGGHHALDPFVALSFAAAATTRLHVQTHILVLPYRNPLLTAKAVLSLDVLSGGRVILGVAPGYLKPEFSALGVNFDERNELTDEAIDVMRRVWTEDEVEFTGRNFRTRGTVMRPPVVQQPHPPIWIGGNSTAAIRRAGRARAGMGAVPEPGRRQLGRAHSAVGEPRRPRPPLGHVARARGQDRADRADRRVLLTLRRRIPGDARRARRPRRSRRDVGGAARRARSPPAPRTVDAVQQLGQDVIAPYRGASRSASATTASSSCATQRNPARSQSALNSRGGSFAPAGREREHQRVGRLREPVHARRERAPSRPR